MYIYPRRKSRRIPIFIGLAAFLCTLLLLFLVMSVRGPGILIAALDLAANGLQTPTPEDTATPVATVEATPTVHPTRTPKPTRVPTVTPTLVPTTTPVSVNSHFIFGRPVLPGAIGNSPDRTYLYGDTQQGENAVHHGEEFVNPIGTPLLAVADGVVVVAGDDSAPHCGPNGDKICGEALNYYGNLVVVELDQKYGDQPVFTLCGHMNTVGVKVGQIVRAGDQIGTVGDTGIAIGPHCHFEVRVGVNDYYHTRNPILWMRPLPGTGALAGSVMDRSGNLLHGLNVFLYLDNATQDPVMDTETYGVDNHPPVNPDDLMHENWAMGDLRAGKYLLRVQIGQLNYIKHVDVIDGQLTFVVFGGS